MPRARRQGAGCGGTQAVSIRIGTANRGEWNEEVMAQAQRTTALTLDYRAETVVGGGTLVLADGFEWLARVPENSLHAVVTDPPYGVKEYEQEQITKRANSAGGIWRIPPSFDGHARAPLPRFTALNPKAREALRRLPAGTGRADSESKTLIADANASSARRGLACARRSAKASFKGARRASIGPAM